MYELASSCNAHADFKSGWQAAIISLWGSAHSLWELVDLYTCVQELVYNSLSEPQLTGGLRAAQRLFRHRGCLVSCQIRAWSLLSTPYMETFPGNQLLPVNSQVATVIWKKSERDRKRKKERERLRGEKRWFAENSQVALLITLVQGLSDTSWNLMLRKIQLIDRKKFNDGPSIKVLASNIGERTRGILTMTLEQQEAIEKYVFMKNYKSGLLFRQSYQKWCTVKFWRRLPNPWGSGGHQ